MRYAAIIAWDAEGRVTKYQDYASEAEAAAHVGRVAGRFAGAFAVPAPAAPLRHWLVDPEAKTVTVEVPAEDLARAAEIAAYGYRATRAEAYRARLGKRQQNTPQETIGDVLDVVLELIEANPGLTVPASMAGVLAERAAIKAEIPKPAEPAAARTKGGPVR